MWKVLGRRETESNEFTTPSLPFLPGLSLKELCGLHSGLWPSLPGTQGCFTSLHHRRQQGLGPGLLPLPRRDLSFLKGEKKKSLGLFHNIFSLYNVLYLKNKK